MHDGRAFWRTFRRQLILCLFFALIGVAALFVVFDWWHQLLVRGQNAATVGFLPVALCVVGILIGSWLGAAVQVVRSAPYSLVTTLVAAAVLLVPVAMHVPAPYLAPLPYFAAISTQITLILSRKKGLRRHLGLKKGDPVIAE
jgi:hypothetical protein